jgi:energy-coupling factor transport system permease protein
VIYRRRASPLHAASAAAASGWCAALAAATLVVSNPLMLGALLLSVGGGAVLAGVRHELVRALRWALPVALAIVVVNALVTRDGLTIIWRFGNLPIVGYSYITAEATAYGAILGLRAVILILSGVLYTTCVDPDELLGVFRRVSYRSALSATLATRLVPLLGRDARRLADAQRCRPGRPPSRAALMRVATSNLLDRALDVAAALEVRGYATARRPGRPRRAGGPRLGEWSRHDLGFAASAVAVLGLSIGGPVWGCLGFSAYPTLSVATGFDAVAVSAAVLVCALAPFADRRGIVR